MDRLLGPGAYPGRTLTKLRVGMVCPAKRIGFVALFALLALSGCGGSSDNGVASKSGPEILAAAKEAALEAGSVHVVGRTVQGLASVSFDMRLGGGGGRGKVSLLGADTEVIRIEDSVYVKGNATFYRRLGRTLGFPVKLQRGVWLKGPTGKGPLSQAAALADLRREMTRILSTPGALSAGTQAKFEGQPAVAVNETTKLYKGVLYVASTGKPYPIAFIKTKGKAKNELEGGRTSFSEWNRPVSVSAPSPWVDVETLRSEARR